MIDAAIVGLGRWGRILVGSVQTAGVPKGDHIRFTHGVTRTPNKATEFCAGQNIELESNFDAVLANPSIDAVVLATPHSQHVDQIRLAAAAGKQVFVEKPLALNRADAAEAANLCREAGLILAVGQNRRFLPLIADLKSMIDTGELGTIVHAEGNFSTEHGLAYTPDFWRANDQESPAGAMTASGIHIIDTFIHLLGPLTRGRAITRRRALNVGLDDSTACLMEFESGATATLGTSPATPFFFRLHIFGTKGWAQMQKNDELQLCFVDEKPQIRTYPAIDMQRAELEAFADAINGRTVFPVPTDQVVHGIAVQDALIASCQQDGAPIDIDR